ncbi:hypothetical protein LUZ60_017452 [Juncus effusus]|nr:hypothetical protein LUZ60_017452 [Juncus effusus]
MSVRLSQSFSLLKSVVFGEENYPKNEKERKLSPSLKIHTDKDVYRPGEILTVSLEISNPKSHKEKEERENEERENGCSLLIDSLSFEVKGIEKVDSQWFASQRPVSGSKQKRGENVFLDSLASSIISKVLLPSASTKTYIVRVELPKILPPSYRGMSIRYIYYVRATLYASWHDRQNENPIHLEARAPLQIWVSQKNADFSSVEGSLPVITDQLSIYWKEKDEDSEWVRANENGEEEEYESSRDEVSSVSSYNPANPNNYDVSSLRNSFSNQSLNNARFSAGPTSLSPSYNQLPQLSISEIVEDSSSGLVSPEKKLSISLDSPSLSKEDMGPPFTPRYLDSAASEGLMRGRSYNIKIDDQILLRFSPKNSDSTYYFGDMIGGTLTFFHGNGSRRCLEVSVTLETSETINQQFIHPSRRVSPTITKVHSEHHEVVADISQTRFLFSVPIDGPMSFSTPKVSVQWSLKFEFFTTPDGLDLSRYEHPLLVERREKGDWVLPIRVYSPPLRRQVTQSRSDNKPSLSLGNLF